MHTSLFSSCPVSRESKPPILSILSMSSLSARISLSSSCFLIAISQSLRLWFCRSDSVLQLKRKADQPNWRIIFIFIDPDLKLAMPQSWSLPYCWDGRYRVIAQILTFPIGERSTMSCLFLFVPSIDTSSNEAQPPGLCSINPKACPEAGAVRIMANINFLQVSRTIFSFPGDGIKVHHKVTVRRAIVSIVSTRESICWAVEEEKILSISGGNHAGCLAFTPHTCAWVKSLQGFKGFICARESLKDSKVAWWTQSSRCLYTAWTCVGHGRDPVPDPSGEVIGRTREPEYSRFKHLTLRRYPWISHRDMLSIIESCTWMSLWDTTGLTWIVTLARKMIFHLIDLALKYITTDSLILQGKANNSRIGDFASDWSTENVVKYSSDWGKWLFCCLQGLSDVLDC